MATCHPLCGVIQGEHPIRFGCQQVNMNVDLLISFQHSSVCKSCWSFLGQREAPRCSWGKIYASGSCKNADSLGNRKDFFFLLSLSLWEIDMTVTSLLSYLRPWCPVREHRNDFLCSGCKCSHWLYGILLLWTQWSLK